MKVLLNEIKRNRTAEYYIYELLKCDIIEHIGDNEVTYYYGKVPIFEYGIFSDLNINKEIVEYISSKYNEDYHKIVSLIKQMICDMYFIDRSIKLTHFYARIKFLLH